MPAPLTRKDLDQATCSVPGCDHTTHTGEGLFLTGVCHPGAPVRAFYHEGLLKFSCASCGQHITSIAVAQWWH